MNGTILDIPNKDLQRDTALSAFNSIASTGPDVIKDIKEL